MIKKILVILTGVILGYFLILFFKVNYLYQKISLPQKKEKIKKKDSFNFLLFGYGGGSHQGAYLTDTIILFHLDIKNKKGVLVSIPRDLWVLLPTESKTPYSTKINAVYQIGLFPENYPYIDKRYLRKKDAGLLKYVINQITDQKIDYYLGIDFEGFKKAVDALGGVEVDVDKSFVDEKYPIDGKENDLCGQDEIFQKAEKILENRVEDKEKEEILADEKVKEFIKNATESPHLAFPCRYERLVFQKGKMKMDGETALKFVRSRHSFEDGDDFSRARRQQLFLKSVKDKLLNVDIVVKIFPLLQTLGDHLQGDFDSFLIENLVKEAKNINQYTIENFVLSTDNLLKSSFSQDNQFILIPKKGENDFSQIQEKIKELFSPSSSPSSSITKRD